MKKFNDFNKESKDSKDEVESTDSNNSLIENFTNKYDLLVSNVEKTNNTVKLFEDIIGKLDQYVKKDELSEFLFSQIVVLKEQFEEFKTNVNTLNEQKNQEITNDVESVVSKANLVIEKVDHESKLYKKKYFEDNLVNEEKFKEIDSKFDQIEYQTILEKIESFNENLLGLQEVVDTTLPQQDKKVEKFIIENEEAVKNVNKTSEKLQLAVTEILKDFETKLNSLSKTFLTSDSLDSTNKKYNKKIVEVNNQFEKIRKDFTKVDNHYTLSKDQFKDIGDKLNSLTENIFAVEQRIKGERDKQNYKIVEADTKLDKKIEDVKADVDNVTSDVSNLKETVISDLGKVENNLSEIVSKDIKDAKDQLEEKIKKVKIEQSNVDIKLKKTFNEQFKKVKNDIVSADNKITKQLNKYKLLENKTKSIITDVKNVFKDKKFVDLNKKITFIEETLEKFNEKTVLTEELVNNPAETNKDPLTPLNQNFVTFDQLKKHYQLFINRIQQQLMTVGGGGAVRIDQLDDVDHNSVLNAQNGQALVFITEAAGGNNKFEVRTVATSGGIANVDANVSTVGGADGDITNAQILSFVTRAVSANGGNLSLSGNIIPDADNVHSLGTSALRFKDLFLSGNTFVLGGLTLKDTGGALAVTDSSDQTILDASASVPSLTQADLTIANIAGYAANLDTRLTIANVAGYAANLDTRFTGANIGGALTGGTDIEITAGGTINYTGSGGGGGVTSVGGATGAISNAQIGLFADVSQAITIGNVSGYAANLDTRFTGANIGGALTGGTDIEITSDGTVNFTGSGGSDAVASIGGYTGAVKNTDVSNIVITSGVLKTANVSDTEGADGAVYFSNARANAAIESNVVPRLTTANVSEVTNLYYTDARFDTRLGTKDTDDLSEGSTNLYYANSRANSTLVANLNYSNIDFLSNIVGADTQIQLTSEKNFIRFYAANQTGFPAAATFHGAIMHSHADAAMYFAHGGAWIRMIDDESLNTISIGGYTLTDPNLTNDESNTRISNIVVSSGVLTGSNVSGVVASVGGYTGTMVNTMISNIVISSGVLETANVSELTNLYFTDARARSSISTTAGSRNYNSSTGVITIPETTAHISDTSGADGAVYFSNARANAAIEANVVPRLTTANVVEFTSDSDADTRQVFYSNTRANAAIDVRANALIEANVQHSLVRSLTLAASDETTDLTTGTAKVTFRAPFAMTLPATPLPRASLQTAASGTDLLTVDINEGGTSILSTKLTFDSGAKTTTTATTPCVVSDSSIADDAEITVDIDQIGDSAAGKGLKITLYYTVTE